jgi:hypothetical protein
MKISNLINYLTDMCWNDQGTMVLAGPPTWQDLEKTLIETLNPLIDNCWIRI